MSETQEIATLHPLVEKIRLLFGQATARFKKPHEAVLDKPAFDAAASQLKSCGDNHHDLGVDLVAVAICFARNQWRNGAEQVLKLAAMVLSEDEVADQIEKQERHHGSSNPKATQPWADGLKPPSIGSTKKTPRR